MEFHIHNARVHFDTFFGFVREFLVPVNTNCHKNFWEHCAVHSVSNFSLITLVDQYEGGMRTPRLVLHVTKANGNFISVTTPNDLFALDLEYRKNSIIVKTLKG